ncbi:DUF637 domain-containing protein [Aeromonas enteropelogenes]
MIASGLSSLAGVGASSFVNNEGNLQLVWKDVTSAESLRGAMIGAVARKMAVPVIGL